MSQDFTQDLKKLLKLLDLPVSASKPVLRVQINTLKNRLRNESAKAFSTALAVLGTAP